MLSQSFRCNAGCLLTLIGLPFATPAPAQFTYETNNNEITITGYTGGAVVVTVPDTITGYPVTKIGDAAFQYSYPLAAINLPSGLTTIGNGAFKHCSALTNVVIPNGTTNIEAYAFFNSGLRSITIPATVTRIGDGAFNSTHLTSIVIPDGVPAIADDTFVACNFLEHITIPPSVTSIGRRAFESCYALTDLTLPPGVTDIGGSAFVATGLTNVFIPASVNYIGDFAFQPCASLSAITVAEANPVYRSQDGVLFDQAMTTLFVFPNGKSGRYRIPDGVTTIYDMAFKFGGESQLASPTNIIIPATVTSIGADAFAGCEDLTTVFFLGNAPAEFSDYTFYRSDNVTVYYLPGTIGWSSTFAGRPTALWNPTVPPGSIGMPTNQFGFNITGTADIPVTIEASTNLVGTWEVLQSLRLNNGAVYFSDPQSGNHPQRYYRLGAP